MDRRLGVLHAGTRVERQPEGDGLADAHEPGGRQDALGRELVERASLIVIAPTAPGADPLEQRCELRGAHLCTVEPHGANARTRRRESRRPNRVTLVLVTV